jgi:hypothetical protein
MTGSSFGGALSISRWKDSLVVRLKPEMVCCKVPALSLKPGASGTPLAGLPMIRASHTITATLHEHQEEGLSWLVHMYKMGVPAILGDQVSHEAQTNDLVLHTKAWLNLLS